MITKISLVIIIAVAIFYCYLALRVKKLRKDLENNTGKILNGENETIHSYKAIIDEYFGSMIDVDGIKRNNTPSSYYINEQSLCKADGINLRLLDTASGTLVGLGLLGTFLGLTVGIADFDSSSTDTIQQSIQSLLNGMSTAFYTSLAGMGVSILFTLFCDKPNRNKFDKAISTLTSQLDNKYYIDDVELTHYHNEQSVAAREKEQSTLIRGLFAGQSDVINKASDSIVEKIESSLGGLTSKLQAMLTQQSETISSLLQNNLTYNKEGEEIPLINIVRELHTESREQTKALKSFSTDLAIELNNGFDEMLSRQLQAKLIPLMESVDRTTKAVIEHIDLMADAVKSPADNMVNNVVGELKTSLQDVMQDFKSNISENTKDELERVAHTLSDASSVITTFPENMERITQSFQTMIMEMKQSVADTTKGSIDASADAILQMKGQILDVNKTLADSVENIRTVMTDLTMNTQKGNTVVMDQMNNTVNSVNERISQAMSQMGATLTEQMSSLSDDVASKQTDLLALQEDTVGQIRTMLAQFNESIGYMENTNRNVSGTLNQMESIHTHIASSASDLHNVSENMKSATNEFHKTQANYTASVLSTERATQESITKMDAMLSKTGEVSEEYLSQFGTLKEGLGKVFSQIQEGLNSYSMRVRETTSKYLSDYSTALTNTVDQINNTVGEVRDIVDALEEQLSKLRR